MPNILCIETSTHTCSVSVINNYGNAFTTESNKEKTHASLLLEFIDKTLSEAGIKKNDLHAVSVSLGPGSYTGLRIGMSTAKGLAYGLNIPLIGVSTLEALAEALYQKHQIDAYYMPVIDARRMEVYTAVFDNQTLIRKEHPLIIHNEDDLFKGDKIKQLVIGGDGAAKIKPLIQQANILVDKSIEPSASYLGMLSLEKFNSGDFSDTAYVEPIYLK